MHWHETKKIAHQLEDHYNDYYKPIMKDDVLKEMITSLMDFEDHEVAPPEGRLEEILEKWTEIRDGIEEDD